MIALFDEIKDNERLSTKPGTEITLDDEGRQSTALQSGDNLEWSKNIE